MDLLLRLLLGAVLIYGALTAFAFFLQRQLQYFPDRSPVPLPAGERFRGLEEVELVTADGVRLAAWHWPGARPPTIVIFHGNAGHRGNRLPWMVQLHDLGFGVFCLDYRGYGGSGGAPTERGLFRDADATVAWLAARAPGALVYLGESLGCGVAVELAVRHPPAGLILQSGFTSAVDIAASAYPFLPVRLMMWDRFECRARIERLRCPLLMIHGERDTIIPMRLGRALFEAAPEPKEWLVVRGADHNDPIWVDPEYAEKIEAFLRRASEG